MNYKVYQGTELKQTVTSKTAVMNGLQPNKTYDFSVQADNGNRDLTSLLFGTGQDIVIDDTANTGTNGWRFALFNLTQQPKVGDQITVSAEGTLTGRGDLSAYDAVLFDSNTTKPRSDTKSLTAGKRSSVTLKVTNLKGAGNTVLLIYAGHVTDTEGKKNVINNLKVQFGSVATTSVTTRGIRFNIPKTLTVGSNITLRYEEYPLGIVPIGNEPSGMFGGGNKQNLSAKVISTANGSSVVEVAGNVIEVSGRNLLTGTEKIEFQLNNNGGTQTIQKYDDKTNYIQHTSNTPINRMGPWWPLTPIVGQVYTLSADVCGNGYIKGEFHYEGGDNGSLGRVDLTDDWERISNTFRVNTVRGELNWTIYANNSTLLKVKRIKIETGDVPTPYASFVDGDTFTAQPDGTCALISEYKALYY